MTTPGDANDRDLRDAFAVLRREDERGAPAFETVRDRVRPRRVAPLGGLLAAASVAAAVLGLVVRHEDAPAPMPTMERWIAPTDFLLETPGREIVRTIPRIGGALETRSVMP